MGFVVLPARIAKDEDVGEQDVVLETAAGKTALDKAFAPDDADRADHLRVDVPAIEFFYLHAARLYHAKIVFLSLISPRMPKSS